jgi:hypothetical protein
MPTMVRLPESRSSEVFMIPWRSARLALVQAKLMAGDLGVVDTMQSFLAPGTNQ